MKAKLKTSKQIKISENVSGLLTKENKLTLIKKACALNLLLKQITPDNIHSEISTGSPVGKEEIVKC